MFCEVKWQKSHFLKGDFFKVFDKMPILSKIDCPKTKMIVLKEVRNLMGNPNLIFLF